MELWGIDLGGTKIEGVVITSIDPLEVACRVRIPTEAYRGYEHIISQIAALVDQMVAETGFTRPARIGVGTPGTVDPTTGRMNNCNTVCLNDAPLPSDLSAALGMEVMTANDANCFALAEALLGAGRGYPTVFGVIMGTGVGGGIVVDGRVLGGAQGIAGEWGHNLLEPDGELCYCGRRGCVETVISGPALERYFARLCGARVPLSRIADLARESHYNDTTAQRNTTSEDRRCDGDIAAVATITRLCDMFGKAMAQVVNILDPHAIILGGGVGNVPDLYTHGREELAKHVFNNRLETKLLKPELGDSAGVFGAALLGLPIA